MSTKKKKAARSTTRHRTGTRRWSKQVTEHSHALDLEGGVFSKTEPHEVAESLKRSAEHSRGRKASAYRSALSMLTFYINRAGRQLSRSRKRVLERAKRELRQMFTRKSEHPKRRRARSKTAGA